MIGYITSTLVFYFSCLFFCAIPQESYVHFFFQVEDCVVNVHVTGSVSFFKLIFHAHLKLVKKKACLLQEPPLGDVQACFSAHGINHFAIYLFDWTWCMSCWIHLCKMFSSKYPYWIKKQQKSDFQVISKNQSIYW